MTDKRIKEDCPFCGCKANRIEVTSYGKNSQALSSIHCPDCGASFSCYGKQNCIDKWNRRFR